MKKKYEMIPEDNLFRIKALRSFGDVMKGQLGGLIEKEYNLSHEGDCWIYDNAIVSENAQVRENAIVSDSATVRENAIVSDSATVTGNAIIHGNACVIGNARITGHASIAGCAQVYGDALVEGDAVVTDNAIVCDAHVYGCVFVLGRAIISGDAEVSKRNDYIVFKNWWSSGRYFTWTRSNDMWNVGCFYGTGEELVEKAYADSKEKGEQYKLIVEYVERIKNVQICKQDSVASGEDDGDD